MEQGQDRYGIEELADLGGVSRRTVRFYVQEELLPPPLGVGRGRHYDRTHLDRLLQVKALQESGRTLDEIRALVRRAPGRTGAREGGRTGATVPAVPPVIPRSAWRRLDLAPGVELLVSNDIRLPAPGRLSELAEWCRAHLSRTSNTEE